MQLNIVHTTILIGIIRPWRFLYGDIEKEDQVTLLARNYKNQREGYRSYMGL